MLGLGWWWLGSGVDQRYVGQWADQDGTIWQFNFDGSFEIAYTPYSGSIPANQRWWAIGNSVVIYSPSDDGLPVAIHPWQRTT